MTLTRRTWLAAAASTAALPARAQSRPIRLVVPYPPGGPLDVVARALAERVKDTLGPVIVDNKPGAGGNLGADLVAKSAPDGQTLVMGAVATHAINPWLYSRMPYDPLRDFTPITRVAQVPNVVVLNAETAMRLGISSLRDLVAYAKKNPGRLNVGSGGNGSAGHLAGEMFKSQAGLFIVHIPYAGGPAAQLALLSGQVDFTIDNLATASANIKSGKLKALAVTGSRRDAALPDVPTAIEQGLKGLESSGFQGLVGPAGLPREVVDRLAAELRKLQAQPELKARFAAAGSELHPRSPAEFAAHVKAESEKWSTLIRQRKLQLD